jgi:Spy/CpxP family protein refolding chaperone
MTRKNIILTALLVLLLLPAFAVAQTPQTTMSDEDRDRWLSEMRNYKHEFFTRELKLSRDQQREFFSVYDAMEDEINRISTETRDLERRVLANDDASNTEMESAARAVFEQKNREGEIEMSYFDKFKTILSSKQLLRLKNTERKFTQSLVQQHRKLRRDDTRKQ